LVEKKTFFWLKTNFPLKSNFWSKTKFELTIEICWSKIKLRLKIELFSEKQNLLKNEFFGKK